jgi:hypothetical protein
MSYNLPQKTHYAIPANQVAYPGMWEVYTTQTNNAQQGGPPEFKGRFPTYETAVAKMNSLNLNAGTIYNSKDSFDN